MLGMRSATVHVPNSMQHPKKAHASAYRLAARILAPYFHSTNGAGHPITSAKPASSVSPHPYPSALYIAGANSGKPNPARLRRQDTAARALAACSVKASMTYVWMPWKLRMMPAPTRAMPCARVSARKYRPYGATHDVGHDPVHMILHTPARNKQPDRQHHAPRHHRRQAVLRQSHSSIPPRVVPVDAVEEARVDLGRAGEADAERDVVEACDPDALVVDVVEDRGERRQEHCAGVSMHVDTQGADAR
jgi:hypothetical protein